MNNSKLYNSKYIEIHKNTLLQGFEHLTSSMSAVQISNFVSYGTQFLNQNYIITVQGFNACTEYK